MIVKEESFFRLVFGRQKLFFLLLEEFFLGFCFYLQLVANSEIIELLLEVKPSLNATSSLNKAVEPSLYFLFLIAKHPFRHGMPTAQHIIFAEQFRTYFMNFIDEHEITPKVFRQLISPDLQINRAGDVCANQQQKLLRFNVNQIIDLFEYFNFEALIIIDVVSSLDSLFNFLHNLNEVGLLRVQYVPNIRIHLHLL